MFLLADGDAEQTAWRLAVALGIGLLLGIERERRKGRGRQRAPAGIRTFALVALLGGLAAAAGETAVVAVAGGFVAVAAVVAYLVSDRSDPGMTTEVALMVVFLLGALAQDEPELAAGTGTAVAIVLAARGTLHSFAKRVLTEDELHDGLMFAAAALVVLPLVPNEAVGPYAVLNPFALWRLVVLVMGVSGAGYIAQRALGPRLGLPLAGFAGGFFSSSATVGAMGGRAAKRPNLARPALAGAVLSSVATVVLLGVVVGATNADTLRELSWPLIASGLAATGYGGMIALRALRKEAPDADGAGRAFDLKAPVAFAATVAVALFASAAVNDLAGQGGLVVATAVTGFADAHSAAFAATSLVAAGKIEASEAVVPILAAFTTNSITKAAIALGAGGRAFATQVWLGLAAMTAAAWVGFALGWGL